MQGLPEIEIRDERGEREQSQSAWIAAIARRLERYERDGVPFAVLLVELADVERLRQAELPGEMARLTGWVETATSRELRDRGRLAQRQGRRQASSPASVPEGTGCVAPGAARIGRPAAGRVRS